MMSPGQYDEDHLVQQTTAEYLEEYLGWDSVYAFNNETFGPKGTLGRDSDRDIVLTRYVRSTLEELNPGLPDEAYDAGIRQLTEFSSSLTTLATNREKYDLLKNGIQVIYKNEDGERTKRRLKLFDFKEPANNHFLCVRELWVKGTLYRRRADIVGFVNGIPLLFMELKNVNKNIKAAYEENFSDYKDTVPHLFHHNAVVVIGNGIKAKIGTISSKYEHFHEWKRLQEDEPGKVDMETLLKGICDKNNFMDLFENFILFDDSEGETKKILARNHQFLGVNQAIQAVSERQVREGRLGVFWHTQGSGKSYSMVFFTQKVHRKLGGNYTFLICTDRDDLDRQIYHTFAGCGLADNDKDPCRPKDGDQLHEMLTQHKAFVFTLIHKFNKDVYEEDFYSNRDDIIVITDEAHRSQYGRLSLNMRNALPRASFIGFTGTPLFKDDEITRRVFGEYISTYDFQRAVEDDATVPLYYDARGEKLGITTHDINDKIATKLEELEIDDINVQERLEQQLSRDYHIITANKRLEQAAKDFVDHYTTVWRTGKAMLVCIDKITCVKMYNLIEKEWIHTLEEKKLKLSSLHDPAENEELQQQIDWMEETIQAVVVSEEQGEVKKFKRWGLDIKPHRKLLKEGFELADGKRIEVDNAFKKDEHPFRIAIVCAMWLTGFDVPSLSTLYLDKPLKAHTLMQAIARANRKHENKNNGLIVDYCGILKGLRAALATFAGKADSGHGGDNGDDDKDPTKPHEELLEELEEAIVFVESFLKDRNASLDHVINQPGFARNAAIEKAKEAANENDESRKRFEILCREVFRKFKACLTIKKINDYRSKHDAIAVIYKSLESDKEHADISDIMKELHAIVDDAIDTKASKNGEESNPYDISKIDFERLRQEFTKSPRKNTTVQNLKQAVENRLQKLLQRNPLRTDFQEQYEKMVRAYNQEKDRQTIEATFTDLLKLVDDMTDEENRAIREGLDEESLAIYDLLKKPELKPVEIKRIKKVSSELLELLKKEKLKVDHWQDKESTRDAVKVTISNYLYSDKTGLPVESFDDEEVQDKADAIFRHIMYAYPKVPSPIYAEAS